MCRLEKYLDGFPTSVHQLVLRQLLSIEIEHVRGPRGELVSERSILDAHPQLARELAEAFQELRALGTARAGANELTVRLPAMAADPAKTIEHTTSGRESRGLHIRCPYCSNPVELLADTPFEDVSCTTCGSMFSLVSRDESTRMAAPLKSIDRFDLVARLGVGGFGTVWKARDRELDRIVAVKIPRRGQLSSAEIEQFFREARSAAQLRHPNIVPVYEVGREGETLFIVSDFVRGVTLSDWLTGHRPGFREVALLSAIIANALEHAHEHGIVHRDLKPSNIMLDEVGQPHLMDFGLAKRATAEITMTVEGQILGTPAYMSPEQAAGEGHWTDRRSDIYSFGVILFELLTGELPFRGNAQMQVHQRLTEDAPEPRKLNRFIPRDLATICAKCLEREPGRRYSTSAALGEEFQRYLRGEPIEARPLSRPARAIRWAQRKPLLASTAALVTFMAIAGPSAALVIDRQRSRLADLVTEKNHLIDQFAAEKKQDAAKVAQQREQLDVWEGKSNPWKLWPPAPGNPPRREVLESLLGHAKTLLVGPLKSGNLSDEDQAYGYLSLATIADAMSDPTNATRYYQIARERLSNLRQQAPLEPRFSRALAECELDLARVTYNADRAKAKELAENARSIWQQLAGQPEDVPADQIEWLESEMYSATLVGFEKASIEHMRRAAEISRRLTSIWPNTFDELYRLTCRITKREPFLIGTSPVP